MAKNKFTKKFTNTRLKNIYVIILQLIQNMI